MRPPNPFDELTDKEDVVFIITVHEGSSFKGIIETRYTKEKTLALITGISAGKENKRVGTIRSIDTKGKVKEYGVVFDGRIKLQEKEDVQPEGPKLMTYEEWEMHHELAQMEKPKSLIESTPITEYSIDEPRVAKPPIAQGTLRGTDRHF